jgi:hypothetical protein
MDVTNMLRDDRAAWDELVAILEAHPREVLHDPASVWRWTSRDVYAHLARWLTRSMDELEVALAGGPPLPPLQGTEDEINMRWQREDSGLSLDEARERAQAAFGRRLRLVQSVPGEAWNAALERIARYDGAEHYRAHRGYIVVA